jgi:hypothetical protein
MGRLFGYCSRRGVTPPFLCGGTAASRPSWTKEVDNPKKTQPKLRLLQDLTSIDDEVDAPLVKGH